MMNESRGFSPELVTVLSPRCMVCGKSSEVTVVKADFDRWQGGDFIQIAFPEMPPAQREVLMSGTHPECWDSLFAEEDEEDE